MVLYLLRGDLMDALLRDVLVPELKWIAPGYQLASSYRPAWRTAPVGGDFYNFFPLAQGQYVLWVGDVGGKGLEAAALALRLQPAMVAMALRPEASPATLLDEASRFWKALGVERIVTIFTAILDPFRGEFVYCSAGHEPALLSKGGKLTRLGPTHAALTGLATGLHSNFRQDFGPGDLLLLYTDGLTEAGLRAREGPLGLEAIERLVASVSETRPDEILRSLCRTAGQRASGQLHDDIVMVALRRSKDSSRTSISSRRCQECCDDCGCSPGPARALAGTAHLGLADKHGTP